MNSQQRIALTVATKNKTIATTTRVALDVWARDFIRLGSRQLGHQLVAHNGLDDSFY